VTSTSRDVVRYEIQQLLDIVQKQIVVTTRQLETLTDQYSHLIKMWEATEDDHSMDAT
jgi:hypothetical protein